MKRNILYVTAALFATGSLLAAPKDDVTAAIKKLADSASYSWTSTVTNLSAAGGGGGGRGFGRGGPASGKASKDGYAIITRAGRGGASTDTIVKGEKSVSKNADTGAWETPEERMAAFGGGGGGGGGGFAAMFRTQNLLPTQEAGELLAGVSELKSADGAYSGDLSKEAVSSRLTFGRGRGGGGEAPPPPANPKGSAKFWIKDGVLAKYEYNVQGQITGFQGDPQDVNRTTIVEIKDVGTTKVEVPEDAKKKLQ